MTTVQAIQRRGWYARGQTLLDWSEVRAIAEYWKTYVLTMPYAPEHELFEIVAQSDEVAVGALRSLFRLQGIPFTIFERVTTYRTVLEQV